MIYAIYFTLYSQKVKFTAIIRHSDTSKGEGAPVMFRIMMDQFLGFIPNSNNVTTNYTGDRGTSLLIQDEEDRQGSFLELAVHFDFSIIRFWNKNIFSFLMELCFLILSRLTFH